jgi:lysosomal Pro-X carboxypeptidase
MAPSRLLVASALLGACLCTALRVPVQHADGRRSYRAIMGLGGVVPHQGILASDDRGGGDDDAATPAPAPPLPPRPGTQNCTLKWFDQVVDHFSFTTSAAATGAVGVATTPATTFKQRYFVCDVPQAEWKPNNTILFYTGNEANVELYVNATGFAWEHAAELGALIIFMEHRFYGESIIPGAGTVEGGDLHLLTMEQALADYATAIYRLKAELNSSGSAVVALGGSYGGMLSAWLRMKYPAAVQGALACSAPILAFVGLDQFPHLGFNWDSNAYWRVVTRDATPAAGAEAGCDDAVRSTWVTIFELAQTAAGRTQLTVR